MGPVGDSKVREDMAPNKSSEDEAGERSTEEMDGDEFSEDKDGKYAMEAVEVVFGEPNEQGFATLCKHSAKKEDDGLCMESHGAEFTKNGRVSLWGNFDHPNWAHTWAMTERGAIIPQKNQTLCLGYGRVPVGYKHGEAGHDELILVERVTHANGMTFDNC